MNQKHRLMCESWVEKRPEVNYVTAYGTSSSKQSIKWKTRYAMLVVSPETRMSEIRFYQKKPRSCTEITDDILKLQPWQYIVDIPSWIVDKGRPHVLRLRLLPETVVPGQHYRLQIAYQSSEEATAWMRCVQNQTKLTSGIQGHSFGVVAEECSATARIGIAGKHCLLFVSPTQVILAHKTDRSVVCVWPFETIRSYASDDDRRLVIEAGRCAPLGEGVYSFRTRENDDNVLFDLFDLYTTTATVEPPKTGQKSNDGHWETLPMDQTESTTSPSTSQLEPSGKSRKALKQAARADSDRIPLISPVTSGGTPESDEAPQKPPLPENRKVYSVSPTKVAGASNDSSKAANKNSNNNNTEQTSFNGAKKTEETVKVIKTEKGNATLSKGIYDLDKLLYSLEGTIRRSQENLAESEISSFDYQPSCNKDVNDGAELVKDSNSKACGGELAYAINTIKMDSENALKNSKSNCQSAEVESTRSKPEIAHKPKMEFSTNLPVNSRAPYAKVDVGKKRHL